jgi:hypothetical protein
MIWVPRSLLPKALMEVEKKKVNPNRRGERKKVLKENAADKERGELLDIDGFPSERDMMGSSNLLAALDSLDKMASPSPELVANLGLGYLLNESIGEGSSSLQADKWPSEGTGGGTGSHNDFQR